MNESDKITRWSESDTMTRWKERRPEEARICRPVTAEEESQCRKASCGFRPGDGEGRGQEAIRSDVKGVETRRIGLP
jgi:hypothetical protein